MNAIKDILKDKTFHASKKEIYEFQVICSDLEKDFGKGVWSLVKRIGVTNNKLRDAGKIARERGILTLGYLVGILRKL